MLGLVVGIVGVLWGSQGALQTAQYAQAEIWNIPDVVRPNFWARLGRTACMTVVLGVFLLASTVLAGLVTIGHHGRLPPSGRFVLSLVLNIGLFVVAFRVLTPTTDRLARTWCPGPSPVARGGRVLQYLGGLLVEHSLRNTSKEYGTFALVLGLHRIPLPCGRDQRVRRGAERGQDAPSVAADARAATTHAGRQGGAVFARARGKATARSSTSRRDFAPTTRKHRRPVHPRNDAAPCHGLAVSGL